MWNLIRFSSAISCFVNSRQCFKIDKREKKPIKIRTVMNGMNVRQSMGFEIEF